MKEKIVFFVCCLLLFFQTGCQPRSSRDFRERGKKITASLISELRHVHTKDDLKAARAKIKTLFDELVDLIICAEQWQAEHEGEDPFPEDKNDTFYSEHLQVELWRIYHLEMGREIIEECQEEALLRLRAHCQAEGKITK